MYQFGEILKGLVSEDKQMLAFLMPFGSFPGDCGDRRAAMLGENRSFADFLEP